MAEVAPSATNRIRESLERVRNGASFPSPLPRDFDLTGYRFGELVVTRFSERRGRDRVWECRCEGCGQILLRASRELTLGHRKNRWQSCLPCARKRRGRQFVAAYLREKKRHLTHMWDSSKSLYCGDVSELDRFTGTTARPACTWSPLEWWQA